jgi:hypothetical protein
MRPQAFLQDKKPILIKKLSEWMKEQNFTTKRVIRELARIRSVSASDGRRLSKSSDKNPERDTIGFWSHARTCQNLC